MPQRGSSAVWGSPVGAHGRPSQELSDRLGRHILDVALTQFSVNRFEGTSMDSIAAAAQVTKRTLYMRYGSKRGLLLAILEQDRSDAIGTINARNLRGDTHTKLLHLARKVLDVSLTSRAIGFESLMKQLLMLEPDRQAHELLPLGGEAWIGLFKAVLEEEPALSGMDDEALLFTASYLFDALITTARIRILLRRDLKDSPAAKKAFQEKTLLLLAGGLPFLRPQGN